MLIFASVPSSYSILPSPATTQQLVQGSSTVGSKVENIWIQISDVFNSSVQYNPTSPGLTLYGPVRLVTSFEPSNSSVSLMDTKRCQLLTRCQKRLLRQPRFKCKPWRNRPISSRPGWTRLNRPRRRRAMIMAPSSNHR